MNKCLLFVHLKAATLHPSPSQDAGALEAWRTAAQRLQDLRAEKSAAIPVLASERRFQLPLEPAVAAVGPDKYLEAMRRVLHRCHAAENGR